MRLLRALTVACIAGAAFLTGCQYSESIKSRDAGIDSKIWRDDLKGKKIVALVYTNAMNDMEEVGKEFKMGNPKSSSRMFQTPDPGRRKMFDFLEVMRAAGLGLPPSAWHRLANGVGWNSEKTLDGYPLSFPMKDLNDAVFGGSDVGFKELGAKAARLDAKEGDGVKLGDLARHYGETADYLWVARQSYMALDDGMGRARYVGEIRGTLFDTKTHRSCFGLLGIGAQKSPIRYRRMIEGPVMEITSQVKIERKSGDALFRLQFSPEALHKTKVRIAEQIRKDLVDWPNRDPEKAAAQRASVPKTVE